jgi:hypothetical protein
MCYERHDTSRAYTPLRRGSGSTRSRETFACPGGPYTVPTAYTAAYTAAVGYPPPGYTPTRRVSTGLVRIPPTGGYRQRSVGFTPAPLTLATLPACRPGNRGTCEGVCHSRSPCMCRHSLSTPSRTRKRRGANPYAQCCGSPSGDAVWSPYPVSSISPCQAVHAIQWPQEARPGGDRMRSCKERHWA